MEKYRSEEHHENHRNAENNWEWITSGKSQKMKTNVEHEEHQENHWKWKIENEEHQENHRK